MAEARIAELRANKGVIVRGDVTVKLAEYYGFCWGVERAVSNCFFLLLLITFITWHDYCKYSLHTFYSYQSLLIRLPWRMKPEIISQTRRFI